MSCAFDWSNLPFFQTALFVAPILLDIGYSDSNNRIMLFVRVVFGAINAFILLGCVLGVGGIIQDQEEHFVIVAEALFLDGFSLSKKVLGTVIAFNTLIPCMYYFCVPCQKNCRTMRCIKSATKG